MNIYYQLEKDEFLSFIMNKVKYTDYYKKTLKEN